MPTRKNILETEEIFRLLVEAVEEYAIFALDPLGNILTWNIGAARLKGYSAEEAIGRSFKMFYTPEDLNRGHPQEELEWAAFHGKYEEEGWRVRKDGTRFWANVTITAIRSHDGNNTLRGFAKVTRDLTNKKEVEEKLKAAYADLEERVEDRTRELNRAKQNAEAAVKARDEFFSLASHELKTPITTLKLQAQIRRMDIQRGDFSEFSPENLVQLCDDEERQVARLNFLVDNMLDVSRLTSGRLSLVREKFSLRDLLYEVIKRLEPLLRHSKNTCEVKGEDITGKWDRYRLEQVFTNLLSNASKYAPGSKVKIEIKSTPSNVIVNVSDYGRGIAAADLDRIFHLFERIKDSGETTGLGLGLYIAKQIVEAHNGTITIDSQPGKGSTFKIELPKEERNAV